jgi:2,3-bisphosphoglycerate-dependent phosphoglycerate mutase/probable phosphoglycerate mutase
MRTSVYLVRHGQTRYNLERRYQSGSDVPLTGYGRLQMAAVAERLRRIPFTAAVVSPAARTRELAAAVLAGRPQVPLLLDGRWAETNHGRWEGLTYREVLARFPDEARARWSQGSEGRAEGGESLAEVSRRVVAGWQALLQEQRGGRLLVATHATPIQLVLCACFGLEASEHWHWRIDLGSVTCLDVYASGAIVRMVNEVPRIAGRGTP